MCWGICLIKWQASEKTKPNHFVCFECGTSKRCIFLRGRCQGNAIPQSFSTHNYELERLIVTVKVDWKESLKFTEYEIIVSWFFTRTLLPLLLPFSPKKMHRREWLVSAVVSFWTCGDNHICFDYMHINICIKIYMHIKRICFANLFGIGNNLLKVKKLQWMDFEIVPVFLAGPLEKQKNQSKLSGWVITN